MCRAAEILQQLHCPLLINQNRYSMLDRTIEQNGLLAACDTLEKGLVVYSPLAQGLLTDRYLHGSIPDDSRIRTDGCFLKVDQLTEELLSKLKRLQKIAQDRGQTLAQLALCWILQQETVTSILVGASRPEQILDTVKIAEQPPLDASEFAAIAAILE